MIKMIKSCEGCRAWENYQGGFPRCALGYKLLLPVIENGDKLIRISGGDIRPESGICEKPITVTRFAELLLSRQRRSTAVVPAVD